MNLNENSRGKWSELNILKQKTYLLKHPFSFLEYFMRFEFQQTKILFLGRYLAKNALKINNAHLLKD